MDTSRRKLQLLVHPGDEYVASLHPDSLQVLTYVKLAKTTEAIDIETRCSLWLQPLALTQGDRTVALRSEDIIIYLREQFENLDRHLKDFHQAETTAYAAMLKDRLQPAILYTRWLDSRNYLEATRKWYGRILYFPFSIVYLSRRHRVAARELMVGSTEEVTVEQVGLEVVSRAEECIQLLSARLGERDYFYGESPTSLDAMVYGFLEVILQFPLPSNDSLRMKLMSCGNLINFCERVRKNCFPEAKSRTPSNGSLAQSTLTVGSIWKDPTLWMSIGVAALLLGLQGARVGMFRKIAIWVAHRSNNTDTSDTDSY